MAGVGSDGRIRTREVLEQRKEGIEDGGNGCISKLDQCGPRDMEYIVLLQALAAGARAMGELGTEVSPERAWGINGAPCLLWWRACRPDSRPGLRRRS